MSGCPVRPGEGIAPIVKVCVDLAGIMPLVYVYLVAYLVFWNGSSSYQPERVVCSRGRGVFVPRLVISVEEFALSFDSTQALRACKFAFICSGTATLQAALLGAPFVLAYTMRKVEYHIAKAFVGLNVVGLANILYQGACGESAGRGEQRLHTELIQDELSVENLLDSYKHFDYQTYARNAKKLRAYLGYGSSRNVATVLLENLTQTPR